MFHSPLQNPCQDTTQCLLAYLQGQQAHYPLRKSLFFGKSCVIKTAGFKSTYSVVATNNILQQRKEQQWGKLEILLAFSFQLLPLYGLLIQQHLLSAFDVSGALGIQRRVKTKRHKWRGNSTKPLACTLQRHHGPKGQRKAEELSSAKETKET